MDGAARDHDARRGVVTIAHVALPLGFDRASKKSEHVGGYCTAHARGLEPPAGVDYPMIPCLGVRRA